MDLQEYVYNLLSQAGDTVYAAPQQWETFPIISFYQKEGKLALALNGEERLVNYVFQVDIWDKSATPKQVEALTQQVSNQMTGGGFSRQFTADVPEQPGFFHKTLRFDCTVDIQTGCIYGANRTF